MKSVLVGGIFYVEFDIVDQSGNSISTVDNATRAYNTVKIKNTAPVPRCVEVEVSLPNGKRRLEFMVAGRGEQQWKDSTSQIAPNGIASRECRVVRVNGFPSSQEPIQFDRLSQRPVNGTQFVPVPDPAVPFQITVTAG